MHYYLLDVLALDSKGSDVFKRERYVRPDYVSVNPYSARLKFSPTLNSVSLPQTTISHVGEKNSCVM